MVGYFNYFIKCFIRLLTRKYFKFILIFIISFVLFFILNNNIVRAESSNFGNYIGFSDTEIEQFNTIISENKENYDSFFVRLIYNYSQSRYNYTLSFYNYNYAGRLFVSNYNESTSRYHYILHSQYDGSNIIKTYGIINNNGTFELQEPAFQNNVYLGLSTYNYSDTTSYCLYTNRIVYTDNSFTNVFFNGGNNSIAFVEPYFITSNQQLTTFDFDYLQISGGSTKYTTTFLGQEYKAQLTLKYIYNGVTTSIEILDDYISYNSSNNTWQINIPYNALTNSVVVRNGNIFRFVLDYRLQNETGYSISTDDLTYNLTTEQEENINAESNKQLQDAILNTGQQTNNNLNNINNNLTNSNVDNLTQNSLPQDTTSDITSDGVNGIFQSIYNAFCVGQPQDIIFPFPFTDKNITLSPLYVRNALEGSGAGFIIIIIQAFWWYLISRFIIKDIMGKINNIKSGNIENIEKTNIRGDML